MGVEQGTVLEKLNELAEKVDSASSGKVMIFVDNTNLNLTAKRIDQDGKFRIDYNRLVNLLRAGRPLKQTRIYYSDYSKMSQLHGDDATKRQERDGFYSWLRWQGYWLHEVPLIEREGGIKEKGLDAAIIRDMERLASRNAADTFVLVAGDMDYKELISSIQADYGINVEVAFFPECTARGLVQTATRFINLSEAKDIIRRVEN